MATRLLSMLVVHWRLQRCVATVILLVCHGVHRGDGRDRIVVEVVTRDVTSGTFLVSGLSRVQCGFSFPVSNAPRQYDVAMEAAVAAHCGVLEIGPSMAGQEAMPWSLKEAFSSGQSPVAIAGCLITNSTQFLNQSHLHIHTSFIPGAGWGLMIRPCPNATIPSGEYVCHFANPHQQHHRQTMSCPLSDEAYDPHVYDGHNIGRFINQGGIMEGLRELVAASDRDCGCTAYSPTVAEAIFAVVEYHVANGGSEMVVLAAPIGQIHLASTPRTLAVPMPSYAMATLPVFALAAGCSAWEAVNYCDGDGGSILVEQFPGLSKYLRPKS
ncbi:hypothetical protein EMCRGX_G021305 [Ephydatia muelleri]